MHIARFRGGPVGPERGIMEYPGVTLKCLQLPEVTGILAVGGHRGLNGSVWGVTREYQEVPGEEYLIVSGGKPCSIAISATSQSKEP